MGQQTSKPKKENMGFFESGPNIKGRRENLKRTRYARVASGKWDRMTKTRTKVKKIRQKCITRVLNRKLKKIAKSYPKKKKKR